ncbi:MAG: hypothetical protein ACRC0Q_01705 [Kurthia gibsonii]|uniref:Uncharacterized protein n=1 Tax=Kurthia gibsonii TaxID=33946 RepID=A0ABU9LJT9_9BACL|nr:MULTISPECIES: hypothetical protein [Kurthia]AMA62894.1 hypothetical protein ASO14_2265 [Kurthia sp. 11kri321]MEB6111848.1 hypothetical protein [Kurthia gibsonii]MEB7771644.1 hypothetical protein [Kurthia gibsonii]RXH53496.1 hypothetical protein D6T70_00375 [Kurthia gibsonii]WIL39270.1 hypothetical protein QN089_03155 [Kurthia sp. YJT4]
MKQVVHILQKVEFEKQYIKGLQLELDYELATLYDALNTNDEQQIEASKRRLKEIHMELEAFHVFS